MLASISSLIFGWACGAVAGFAVPGSQVPLTAGDIEKINLFPDPVFRLRQRTYLNETLIQTLWLLVDGPAQNMKAVGRERMDSSSPWSYLEMLNIGNDAYSFEAATTDKISCRRYTSRGGMPSPLDAHHVGTEFLDAVEDDTKSNDSPKLTVKYQEVWDGDMYMLSWLWLDASTGAPVQVETFQPTGNGGTNHIVMKFDEYSTSAIPKSEFSASQHATKDCKMGLERKGFASRQVSSALSWLPNPLWNN